MKNYLISKRNSATCTMPGTVGKWEKYIFVHVYVINFGTALPQNVNYWYLDVRLQKS